LLALTGLAKFETRCSKLRRSTSSAREMFRSPQRRGTCVFNKSLPSIVPEIAALLPSSGQIMMASCDISQSSGVKGTMYTESPPLSDGHPEHDVDGSDLDADRVHWLSGTSRRPSGFKRNRFTSTRPSTTRRLFRALARFSVAVLIGVGGTLAWQSYGGEMVRAWAPSLGWLLPAASLGPAVTSAELQAQLKPAALDLAIVRRSVEQLATNQDQLAHKEDQLAQALALVQSAEQDINQKILAIAPPAPKAVVHAPPPKSLQPPAQ
jgi:hypothetical protein